jgi:alginate O-acetyltransferase complex protein AlgI
MVFSSALFLFYFLPVFLLIHQFLANKYKNGFTLIASICFYAWGAPDFVLIALGSIIADFFIVNIMSSSNKRRLFLLWVSILLNLSFLIYFKYFNFFIDNLNLLLGSAEPIQWTEILLPIGISFFTFQKISYSIDIYRREEKPLERLIDYSLYILLFPQLIAGPIVRYKEIALQLKNRDTENYNKKLNGIYRFTIGLAKKVLIANVLGEKADFIFSLETMELTSSLAWFGILCYTFQIYFDFSGYSDMAIGLGLLMGFKFPENFNSPYVSQSITEFWRRWHITLGTWMRDYLYIPLGGNKVNSKGRLYINLSTVFVISGLWHGASWNFVLWGAFHGFFLVADRVFLNKVTAKIPSFCRIILTFVIVIFGWVLFRTENISGALDYYEVLFRGQGESVLNIYNKKTIVIFIMAVILSFGLGWEKLANSYFHFQESETSKALFTKFGVSIVLFIVSAATLLASGFNPFIYFRF